MAILTWTQHPELDDHMIDHAENVLQPNGGVIPKACQKCGKIFKSKLVENKDHDIVAVGTIPRIMQTKTDTIVVCQECEVKI